MDNIWLTLLISFVLPIVISLISQKIGERARVRREGAEAKVKEAEAEMIEAETAEIIKRIASETLQDMEYRLKLTNNALKDLESRYKIDTDILKNNIELLTKTIEERDQTISELSAKILVLESGMTTKNKEVEQLKKLNTVLTKRVKELEGHKNGGI